MIWALFVIILVAGLLAVILINVASYPLERKNPTEKFTIVMNTFKRHAMLEDAIDYYKSCVSIANIHITWSEPSRPPKRLADKYAGWTQPRIIFDEYAVDSLNNRYVPLKEHYTAGIFAVDDDIRVPCADLSLAFEVWRSNQRSIVGFMPRVHVIKNNRLAYRCWWTVWMHGAYSIVLTKAAFLHHDYFQLYTETMPAGVHAFIDTGRNCEDIAMQYLVSNVTSLPPVYVKGHLSDLGVLGGISTSRNIAAAAHMDARSNCLNRLSGFFGGTPLVYSNYIVDYASNGWFNAPSTWGEYISSDLWSF